MTSVISVNVARTCIARCVPVARGRLLCSSENDSFVHEVNISFKIIQGHIQSIYQMSDFNMF